MSVVVVAEIGINHQGDVEIAKKLIDVAIFAGADIVKFQKRTPEICLPEKLWGEMRETLFGRMSYLEYRKKIEFGAAEYHQIDRYCRERNIVWTASPWDVKSLKFLEGFGVPLYKIASPSLTDLALLKAVAKTQKSVILSTGMSTLNQIHTAVGVLHTYGAGHITLMACTSAYPCPVQELNLDRLRTLRLEFPFYRVGYSSHEIGLWMTLCAVAMGAQTVERHITLDRAMPGTDHAASVEPHGLIKLVKEIRNFEQAVGTGEIGPIERELPLMKRLRRVG